MNHSLVPDNQCISCSDYIVGRVWPRNRTVFPDFFKAETVRWWTEQMYTFYKKVGKPDGFWIDMNEPSNFDTNSKRQSDNLICPNNKYENPPYPTVIVREPSNTSKKISDKTICMSAKHTADGKSTQGIGVMTKSEDDNSFIHYDVHNLYGWSEFRATRQAMDYVLEGKRGILVGRSTYPGSGKWGGHWTGDNTSRWKDLRRSIVGLLEFNMFGIPYVGSDICGFNGNTSPRLCLRWTQLGAFYPFCRNHNTDDGRSQDPAVWPEVAAAAREALGLRYRLLPLLYTLLYRAQQSGAMVVRPLPFQFPREAALRGIDTQFMWGNVLMVAPVVTANESMSITDIDSDFDQVEVAFPPGGWFHLHNGSTVANTGGGVTYHKYNVPTNAMIPVFVRNGSIIVTQKNESTTHRSRQNSFEMHVFGSGHAYGELFWDDGESRHTVKSGRYHLNLYRYINSTLSMNVIRNGTCYMHDPFIRRVVFYAVEHQPRAVLIDKEEVDHSILHYDNNALILTPIQIDMAHNHKIQLL
nr:glucosidase 2 alpha-E-like protein [Parasacculina yatsui]